ncbi:MAG: hypothetical protein JRF33_21695 [Deltaproteobacteria bacterium]|nr:hypothetical protein [Deltaproteobacteria bacterium]
MRIGESYLLGQRYAAALAVFEDLQKQSAEAQIKKSALLAGARALYLDKRYVQALLRLDVLRMSEASLAHERSQPRAGRHGPIPRGLHSSATG